MTFQFLLDRCYIHITNSTIIIIGSLVDKFQRDAKSWIVVETQLPNMKILNASCHV